MKNKKEKWIKFRKTSLKRRLFYAFIITSVIPVIIFGFFSYYNSSNIVKENMDELKSVNLQQTRANLDISLESYEDLLYQMYTDDDIIALVDKIDRNEDVSVAVNQLKRIIKAIYDSKDYIRSITILTENGSIVTYNQLASFSTDDAWLENFSLSRYELYNEVSRDNKLHVFGTEYGASFAVEDYYLFHLAHRCINYKKLEDRSAVVIMSLDERLLQEICQSNIEENDKNEEIDSTSFIVDDSGTVISYPKQDRLGEKIYAAEDTTEEKNAAYEQLVVDSGILQEGENSIYSCHDDNLSWNIVNVSDQRKTMDKLQVQRNLLSMVILASMVIITGIIIFLTEQLTASVKKVVFAMNKAGEGELAARVEVDANMPIEIENIAKEFNLTLEKLQEASEKEKAAGIKQRNAEIKALEAQINPHFLYNTLDTINWMAIEIEKYEISNAISALATILRYAIDNSNGIVTIRDEVEWLKKYIFLQQTRLKNTFTCNIHVDQELYEMPIHKLLLQPFIENAILHGFEGMKRTHILCVKMSLKNGTIEIEIEDNGKGIEASVLEKMNREEFGTLQDKNHIGMENAITRIRMYYGEAAGVHINSTYGEGTKVTIIIPKDTNNIDNADKYDEE